LISEMSFPDSSNVARCYQSAQRSVLLIGAGIGLARSEAQEHMPKPLRRIPQLDALTDKPTAMASDE
jgi:hypothetical protein